MLIVLDSIVPLSDFVRNTKSHILRLERTGQPEILTVNGKAEAVVLSAEAFQKLMDEFNRVDVQNSANQVLLELFRSGKISAEQLRSELRPMPQAATIPVKQAFAELDRRIHARRKKKAS